MAERRSAILSYNRLIMSHFLSLPVFTPHFAPHKLLNITALQGHSNFISSVTNAVWQLASGLVRGGGG